MESELHRGYLQENVEIVRLAWETRVNQGPQAVLDYLAEDCARSRDRIWDERRAGHGAHDHTLA